MTYVPRHYLSERCTSEDVDGGQCQLQAAHDGPHAADISDAYLTWNNGGELQGWNRADPPSWLRELPWVSSS